MTQDQMRAAFERWAAELAGPFPFDFALDVFGNYKSQMLFYMFMGWQAGRASSIGDGHDYQRQNPTAYIHESVVRKIIGDRNEWRERASLLSHSAGQADGWISVGERMPERTVTVMVTDGHTVTTGDHDGFGWTSDHPWLTEGATHWMPMPPAPSKEES